MRALVGPLAIACIALVSSGCGARHNAARYGWLRLSGGPASARTEQPLPAILPDTAATPITASVPGPAVAHIPSEAPARSLGSQMARPSPSHVLHPPLLGPAPLLQDTTSYYQQQARPWNKVAVVSLPVTVIGVGLAILLQSTWLLGVAGAIGLALALIGGRHAREHEERGRGFAMPAMIIGAMALFLALLVVMSGL